MPTSKVYTFINICITTTGCDKVAVALLTPSQNTSVNVNPMAIRNDLIVAARTLKAALCMITLEPFCRVGLPRGKYYSRLPNPHCIQGYRCNLQSSFCLMLKLRYFDTIVVLLFRRTLHQVGPPFSPVFSHLNTHLKLENEGHVKRCVDAAASPHFTLS